MRKTPLLLLSVALLLSPYSAHASELIPAKREIYEERARTLKASLIPLTADGSSDDFAIEEVDKGKEALINTFIDKLPTLEEQDIDPIFTQITTLISDKQFKQARETITIGDVVFYVGFDQAQQAILTLRCDSQGSKQLFVFDEKQNKTFAVTEPSPQFKFTLDQAESFFGLNPRASTIEAKALAPAASIPSVETAQALIPTASNPTAETEQPPSNEIEGNGQNSYTHYLTGAAILAGYLYFLRR